MAIQVKNGGALAFSGTGLEQAIKNLKNFYRISENKEIKNLITKVDDIVAVLKEAEKKQISSEVVRLFLGKLKEVAFDAEDLIDELATDAAVQSMGAHTHNIPTLAPNMLGRIHKMNDRLDRLEPQIAMLGLQLLTLQDSCPGLKASRETSSLLPDEASVIGRDREKDQIIQILLSSDDQLVAESSSNSNCFSLLSIVGLGGVGKTTLELSEQHWMPVLKSWKLQQGENDILPALLLSYQYLRADLKQCFAYCSLFSKDRRFSKEEVVQLWEAQSFIRDDRGERLETMGKQCEDKKCPH